MPDYAAYNNQPEWAAVPKVIDGECFCGVCSPCRRATKEMDREQGANAHWIKSTGVAVFDAAPAGVGTSRGTDWAHRPKRDPKEVAMSANERNKAAKKRAREVRYAQRIIKDGQPFQPDPACNHGTTYAYDVWGCKCDDCFQAKFGKARVK